MPTEAEIVGDFFRNHLNNCKRLSLTVQMKNLIEQASFIRIGDTIFHNLELLNSFISNNGALFTNKTESYLWNYELKGLSSVLGESGIHQAKINATYFNNTLRVFDNMDSFFYNVTQTNEHLIIDVYYCLEKNSINYLKKDFQILSTNFQNIFNSTMSDSNDFDNNSVLYFLLLPNYSQIFSKQDRETQEIIKEISNQYLDLTINNRKFITYSIICLISLILEQNLIKIYSKRTNQLPSESASLQELNNMNASKEYCTLKKISGNWEVVFKPISANVYAKTDGIYSKTESYTKNIRNKIFHFQQGTSLNLINTVSHAIRYFVNILMEIEDNEYL